MIGNTQQRANRPPTKEKNVTWGVPRIVNELALLDHTVAESTVAKYIG